MSRLNASRTFTRLPALRKVGLLLLPTLPAMMAFILFLCTFALVDASPAAITHEQPMLEVHSAPLAVNAAYTPTFTSHHYLGGANQTLGIAVGDVNGDGALDIIQGNSLQQSMVYLNDGHGGFGAGVPFGEANNSESIAVGDVNGDGALDIIQGNWSEQSEVYLNDGHGGFGTGVPFGGANWTRSIAVGDVNGDGALDIIQGNDYYQQSVVYLNDGHGGFSAGVPFGEGNNTMSIAVGDVNGDGALDIIQGNSYQQSVVYLNDGHGGFRPGVPFGEASYATSIAVGDVNGDGALDIIQGHTDQQQSVVYLNDGQGGFSTGVPFGGANWTSSIAVGDVNGDGALDIVQGNHCDDGGNCQQSVVYLNDGHGGFGVSVPFGGANWTRSITVGDVNGDGALDIIQGNSGQQSVVYSNDGQGGFSTGVPFGTNNCFSIAVGDVDGDGALDIIQGGDGGQSEVYLNDGHGGFSAGVPFGGAYWNSSIAVGDVNGDGALDIIQGNWSEQSEVYLNDGQGGFGAGMPLGGVYSAQSIAMGDVNGDGALDIIQGNWNEQSEVYLNDGHGGFSAGVPFGGADWTRSIAVGDVNGDHALDIIQGNDGQPSVVYLNDGQGGFGAGMPLGGVYSAQSIAMGDVNGDGALDIIQGNWNEQITVHLNDGHGGFAVVSLGDANSTQSVAVGDVNGDGALDIIQGNKQQRGVVYLNDGHGTFGAGVPFCGVYNQNFQSLAMGDVNGDGALDIIQANSDKPSNVYFNIRFRGPHLPNDPPAVALTRPGRTRNANFFSASDILGSTIIPITYTLFDPEGDPVRFIRAFYSPDGGGKWYTATAASGTPTTTLTPRQYWDMTYLTPTVTLSDNDVVTSTLLLTSISPLTATDVKVWVAISHTQASDLRLMLRGPTGVTATLLNTGTLQGEISQTVMFDDDVVLASILSATAPYGGAYRPVDRLMRFDGMDAYGAWQLRVEDAAAGNTGTLGAWGLRVQDSVGVHIYNWDTFASGFFGQSDNVVFRIEAYPTPFSSTVGVTGAYRYTNSTPIYQHPYASATTFPFRVRGTQVRVFSSTVPVANALVYRLPAGQPADAEPLADSSGKPFRTDAHGYLQGRGRIGISDTLVALLPITATDTYTLYYSSAMPNATGLTGKQVLSPGVQVLTVTAANPLVLFNLDVSLEWDARQDTAYLDQLEFNLKRASEVLYDITNGQAALGNVTVYHDRETWNDAHLRIYANNQLRPFADQGGVATEPITDPVVSTLVYYPGQLSMGATWNRYGNAGMTLGEDWPRTLAHELGHYLLYLDDNYLGLNANGLLVPVYTCTNTIMSDAYRDDYSELHSSSNWLPDCADTLSNKTTGRSDWQTVDTFYPALHVTTNSGPSGLSLAVTQIEWVEPITPTSTLPDPRFYLTYNGARVQPGLRAQAYLFQGARLVNLGRPAIDQVLARGAQPGDRVCVFELEAGRLGCKTIVPNDNQQLALSAMPDWQPDVRVTPVNSQTVGVQVHNLSSGLSLWARLYDDTSFASPPLALAYTPGSGYSGIFYLSEPVIDAIVHIWVDQAEPRREAVTYYSLGGDPGKMRAGWGKMRAGWGKMRAGWGKMRAGWAPVLSGDGQVMLYSANLNFGEGEFYTLQAASVLPQPPSWATVVGKGYWLSRSANAPSLAGPSISMGYAQNEVPSNEEGFLRIYFWDGTSWTALPTTVASEDNLAVAPAQGPGLYVLMSTVEIPLYGPGWNNVAYPVQGTRPVTQALLSISGYYTTVYSYEAADAADPWKVYDVTVPEWVNDLSTLKFGQAYWINVSEDIILRLGGVAASKLMTSSSLQSPPATYYGAVLTSPGFTPTLGTPIKAWVNGKACGQSAVFQVEGQLVYTVNVLADGPGGSAGCGAPGRTVTFQVGDRLMPITVIWNNSRVWQVTLTVGYRVYLPLVTRN